LVPIFFSDNIPYFGIEAFHICAGYKSDITYGFSIDFNTKIMNTFFFLDEVNKGFCMFQPVRVGEYIAAIVPNLFVIQFLN
jgi:hypothetical protein